MDKLIKTLQRQSDGIGLAPSIICSIAWVACGGAVVRFGLPLLWQHPALFWFGLIVVSLVIAFGALVSCWILMSHLDFRRRGYQVKWLTGDEWVYEERRTDGSVECLPLSRKILGDGYPAPCSVHIQSDKSWEQQAPHWAHGRRKEILKRIADLFGGRVRFNDADELDSKAGAISNH